MILKIQYKFWFNHQKFILFVNFSEIISFDGVDTKTFKISFKEVLGLIQFFFSSKVKI